MITITKDQDLRRHSGQLQYSIWFTLSENDNETEFIYIFSEVYKRSYLANESNIDNYFLSLVKGHIKDIQDQSEKSIFDFTRYRFIFNTSLNENSKDNRIGYTDDLSDDNKIKSYYCKTPDNIRSMVQ